MVPRLFLEEMSSALPCDLDPFMAPSAADCCDAITKDFNRATISLPQVLERLFQERYDGSESLVKELDILHLFIVILGMFVIHM